MGRERGRERKKRERERERRRKGERWRVLHVSTGPHSLPRKACENQD
jgi:hypothetical protein